LSVLIVDQKFVFLQTQKLPTTMAELSESWSSLEHLLGAIDVAPDTFLQPSSSLQAASLVAAKRILDPVISDYSVFREVALKGLDVEQVWEQIRLVGEQVKNVLETQGNQNLPSAANGTATHKDFQDEDSVMEEGTESEVGEESDERDLDEDEEMLSGEDISEGEEESQDDEDEFPANPELDDESEGEQEPTASEPKPFKKDVHGLNDEFFSIDDFNRLTEQQDVTNSDDENADEIDYFGGINSFLLF
jgi:U3 small nucleolar RNA-associated protein MPP10